MPDYAAAMKKAAKNKDKKAFYTAQYERAKKTGDKATIDKIESKLPKSSKSTKVIGKTKAKSSNKESRSAAANADKESRSTTAAADREKKAKAGGIKLPDVSGLFKGGGKRPSEADAAAYNKRRESSARK